MKADSYSRFPVGSEAHFSSKSSRYLLSPSEAYPLRHDISIIPDVDSGPLVFGFGPSASGFAIAAAAINGDESTAWQLATAAALVGGPVLKAGELRYTMMPPVGQAVILFGKTGLVKAPD